MTASVPAHRGARPPILLGCAAILLCSLFLGGAAVVALIFLDSGADAGELILDVPAAYAPGSVEFLKDHNVYLVKLRDGTFLGLADLDAANRTNAQRRCRVSPVAGADPALPGMLDQFSPRFSAPATGARLIFREICNGALYDLTGTRLDRDGPPLDRFPASISTDGRVRLDLSHRQCAPSSDAAFGPCR